MLLLVVPASNSSKSALTPLYSLPPLICSRCLLQKITPVRGFSSFKFLPGSRDSVIIALKSSEDSMGDVQATFITVFGEQGDGSWRVLMPETELPGASKFEGLEVIDPLPW